MRPYLPEECRREVFNALHNISHPGVRATRKLITGKFFWPSIQVDVGNWAKQCIQCQKCKLQRHSSSSLASFPPTERFEHLHVDIVGPLPTSPQGHRYIVTMIDRTTRWPEAIPTDDTSAESVAKIIYENWITRFRSPQTITTDQGRNFESNLFLKVLQTMGIKKIRTTAYHPQSNGIVDRWHRTLKTALKTRLSQHAKWIYELPIVLFGLRATRADTSLSAAQLTYGCSIRLPCDFFISTSSNDQEMNYDFVTQLRESISKVLSSKHTSSHGNNKSVFIHLDLITCKQVFVRNDAVKK
ncbi:unnamed protein product [Parnassius mnemosyne]|uniref:RNA-directed DNA polymerase n=1 Tax=Parnassius mnemosyne TaxID=213953 RepID=A0AAV1LIK6_9NEOP